MARDAIKKSRPVTSSKKTRKAVQNTDNTTDGDPDETTKLTEKTAEFSSELVKKSHGKWTLQQKGIFAVVRISIPQNDLITFENGSILSMNKDVDIKTTTFAKGFLGGQTIIQQKALAIGPDAVITLAPKTYGDIEIIDLDGKLFIKQACHLASSASVHLDVNMQNIKKGLFNDLFIVVAEGKGKVAIHGSGGIEKVRIEKNLKISTHHVVAWDTNVEYTLERTASSVINSMFSDKYYMLEFKPVNNYGYVYIQNRLPIQDVVAPYLKQMKKIVIHKMKP